MELLIKIPNDITFVWIPSHIGIKGNEIVDGLANAAIKNKAIDLDVPLKLPETFKLVEKYIPDRWQSSWDVCSTGQQNSIIRPLNRSYHEMLNTQVPTAEKR